MGFCAALHEVYGQTQVQRGWVHKTANVLNAMPKSVQPKVKAHLKDIWMAETKSAANTAFDFFAEAYGVKYVRVVKCLAKDCADLLAFYDFPAEHWKHIRTANPIENIFTTVRQRTTKTKECLSRQTALAMTHQLMLSAKKKWRKLDGQSRLPQDHPEERVPRWDPPSSNCRLIRHHQLLPISPSDLGTRSAVIKSAGTSIPPRRTSLIPFGPPCASRIGA
jgi:transposase-like protein